MHSESLHIEPTILKAGLKLVLISRVLRLVSTYRGSYLKDALCRPFQSLAEDVQPYSLFWKGSYGPNN